MKKIIINQPRYLGDIIFVMAIAQKYYDAGYDVDFPVDDTFIDNNPSIEKYFPGIKFIPISKYQFPLDEVGSGFFGSADQMVINCQITSKFKNHMGMKYTQLNLPINTWREIVITRDFDAESRLLEKLEIKKDDKFNLINEYYSNKKTSYMLLDIKNNYKNIFLRKVDGFSLFDWMGVIERAESIHTVHTSIQYIIDTMSTVTKNIHIYPRVEIYEPHSYYDYLFSKDYIYHPHPNNLKYQIIYNLRKFKRNLLIKIKNTSALLLN